MQIRDRILRISPGWIVELFATSNLAFLAADVYLAHSINAFRSKAEWIPVVFSLAAPIALLAGIIAYQRRSRLVSIAGFVIGYLSIIVGIAGLVFHLGNAFFEQQTLKSLVYTAPFAAPLAYVGIGLLIILNRMFDEYSEQWASWVVFLAMAGFIGNFAMSLADHAQNGLFSPLEWLPVVAASYGASFLLVALSGRSRPFPGGLSLVSADRNSSWRCWLCFAPSGKCIGPGSVATRPYAVPRTRVCPAALCRFGYAGSPWPMAAY